MASDTEEGNLVLVGLAAAVGGFAAVFVDLFQKGDASAVFKLTGTVNRFGQEYFPLSWGVWPDIPVLIMGVLLVVVGIVLAFWSDARTRNAGFYSGASVISVLMTLVPYDTPLTPPSGTIVNKVSWQDEGPQGFGPRGYGAARILPATYADGPARVIFAAAGGQLPVTVVVHLPLQDEQDAITPARVDGRLFDAVSGKEWQVGYADPSPTTRSSGREVSYRFDFVIETGAPRGATLADLRLRVKAPGYKTATAHLAVTSPGMSATIDVTLAPSDLPKSLQGVGRVLDRPSF